MPIALAGAAGAHALAWYLGLLALLLACVRFAWSARARQHRTGEVAGGGRKGSSAPPVLGVGLVIAAAAAFAGIAYVTRNGAFAQVDQVFLDAVQANVAAQVVKHFKWITWFGDARTLAVAMHRHRSSAAGPRRQGTGTRPDGRRSAATACSTTR